MPSGMSYSVAVPMNRPKRRTPPGPILALLALLAAGGCSSPSGTRPMTIAVRDKLTGEPVASAHIDARAVSFFAPMDVPMSGRDAILDPSPPKSVRGVTGPDGTVRLQIVAGHPVQVIVTATGYDVQVVELDEHPADTGSAGRWLDADPGPVLPDQPRRMEVRFLP